MKFVAAIGLWVVAWFFWSFACALAKLALLVGGGVLGFPLFAVAGGLVFCCLSCVLGGLFSLFSPRQ